MNNHDDDSNPKSSKPGQPRNSHSTRDALTNPTLGLDAAGAPATRDLTGVTMGDYKVLQLIGSGGGGQVYQAQHRHMGRMVAIKVLSHMETSTSEMGQRFRREVKTSARLMHPNIVTAFDAGEFDEVPYLVMEFVDGQSLYQLVEHHGPLSLQQATALILQTATGLTYAHSEGIVHRDIKPSNLMVDKDSRLKILDMGLARLSSLATFNPNEPLDAELTSHGTVVGTAGYISPEQISNSRRVDHRTDIYSLGCTYHFLLTGAPPYTGSVMEMLVAHARDPVPTLRATRAEVPLALDSIFQRMMAKELSDRFASMDQVFSALEPFAEDQTTAHLAGRNSDVTSEFPSTRQIKTSDSATLASQKAVGFDIGTHMSHVSWIGEEGYPQLIEHDGMKATPSVVRYQEGEFVIGQQALESLATDAENIGDRFVGDLGQDNSCCVLDGSEFPCELLTAVIARQMADSARQQIGHFKHIAYTVPGCFGDVRRRAYADSFQIAYLDTFTPINASSAVATYYSFLRGWLNPQRPTPKDQMLLIIRFGGGSFDASVVRVDERNISTLAVVGDTSIGGSVWDDRIVQFVADQLESEHGIDIHGDRARLALLRRHCESGKMALTHQDQFPFRVQIKGKALEGVLSRSFVNRLGADLIERAESCTTEALSAASITWDEIDHVLLTGGTSRMPVVRESVEQWSGRRNVTSIAEPEAASCGAALYAQVQIGGSHQSLDFQIQEVTSHYIGIRGIDRQTGKARTSVVIPRNTSLPATAKRIFRTSKDGQTSLLLKIAEGSDKEGQENWLIGSCQIANLPPGQPAGTPIEIELHIAENGTVSVFVESLATGRRSSPEIQRAGGLAVDERNRWRDLLYTGCMDLADPK